MFISGGEDGQVCHQPLYKIGGVGGWSLTLGSSAVIRTCVGHLAIHTPCIPIMETEVKKSQCEYEAPVVCCVLGNRLGTSCRLMAFTSWLDGCEHSQPRHCLLEFRTCLTAWRLPYLLICDFAQANLEKPPRDSVLSYVKRKVLLHLWYEEFWSP